MAYTNNNGQTRVGVRIVPLSVVIPTISALLDSYSGAAAAYSLRKLSATWSGSAIRVRRSSDNTEQNIGFDSNGNLDTIALSSFVGSGSGFVKTWYDQTGNNFNRTQTTAAAQPNIVYLGAINMVNGKPAMYFDGTSTTFALQGPKIGETYQGAGYSSTVLNVTKLDSSYSTTNEYPLFGGAGWYDSRFSINSNKWYLINTGTGISSTVNASANQVVSSVIFAYTTDKVRINGTEVISGNVGISGGTDYNFIGQSWLGKRYKGYFQEHIIYASDKTSVISAMESNMNTYYSAYPNPTSVWNLLNAVYSADTIASSSLKTSLVASYNGESNANDSFGSNNGTANGGLTYGTGKIDNAFNFNGTNAYVSITNTSNQLDFAGDFSISTWVMPLVTSAAYNAYFSNYKTGGTYGSGYVFYLDRNVNKLTFELCASSSVSTYQYSWIPLVNTWYHLTVTRKASTGTKLYINGVEVSGTYSLGNSTINPTYQAGQIYNIGSWNNGTGLGNYRQDAVNLWNKELTASEITELYNSGNGAQYIGDNFYRPTTGDGLYNNNGTAVGGLTYGVGKVGTAFQFNGSNSVVSLPTNSMKFTGDFSFSFFVNLTSTTGFQCVFGNAGYASGQGDRGYMITFNSGKLGLYLYNGGNMGSCASTTTVSPNQWNHFVVIKEGQQMKTYCNGVLENTLAFTGSITYITPSTFPAIGVLYKHDGVSTSYYPLSNGSRVDAFNVWDRVLTQSEITELYNSGNGKQYPN